MSMGFKNTEARLALRATSNNVDESVELILKVYLSLSDLLFF